MDREAGWSSRKKINRNNGHRIYVDPAVSMGMATGGVWTSLKDWSDVQLRKVSGSKAVFSVTQINEEMETGWANLNSFTQTNGDRSILVLFGENNRSPFFA